MIRNGSTIFGEVNDENTVLTNDTLTANKLVVGAGNKSIKKFVPGNKTIIITDSLGNAGGLPYGQSNKLIGTDENGDLTLLDIPHEYSWFNFGNAQNLITNIASTSDGITYTYNEEDGASAAIISKAASDYTENTFTVTFDRALILSQATECHLIITVAFGAVALKNLKIVDNSDNAILLQEDIGNAGSGAALSINKTVTLPAGTYKKLQFTEAASSINYSNQALVINAEIIY